MKASSVRLACVLALPFLAACSTLDSINPFASKPLGPKVAELKPFVASAEARVLWREGIGKPSDYVLSPAVVDDSVYVVDRDGVLTRFDGGRKVWRVKVGQTVSGGVGADSRTVVVGTPKGEVLAFSAADGSPLWSARATSEVLAPPVIGDDVVVVRSGDNRLAAFELVDGKRRWTFQRPSPALAIRVAAAPLIADRYVFAGFPGGKLVAVSLANGAPVWEGTVAVPKGVTELDRVADITSTPAIDGQEICAAAYQGRVACFDLGNGSLIWAREMSSSAGLAIDSRYVYVSDDRGAVHALDRNSGASIWKQDRLAQRRLTAPLVRRGLVAVADLQGVVHFLKRDDGAFAARLTTDGNPVVAPLKASAEGVVVQTQGGAIYAIEAQ
ncbi:outer membrane protein assembly factor BamB [Rhodocyclus gracilis]|uniref:Outer membrane protein assembly factor BamB n=1 Tax=Rhodocyclus tenuis TaxID=1066 RepID=A0A6L5JYH2_RHOTE|nr:outer membrane protein assembly factor BamB [Rhodocyclus gracilis]MQY51248.1 outer membrane protein assembly factor BamB [Rhodocyclus gracilis]